MKVRPMDDRVIVKAIEKAEVSKGGIALVTEVDKTTVVHGVVLSVGPGRRNEDGTVGELDVKVGDVAVFETSVGNPITIDGKALIVVKEGDILAVITP